MSEPRGPGRDPAEHAPAAADVDSSSHPGEMLVAPRRSCGCHARHKPRLVVLTGGPGAGKTAVLEIVRRHFCEHVVVLPESASMLFAGGFPRLPSRHARCAAQRAIFHVQRELEAIAIAEEHAAVVLCDRGTLDGLAYWPAPAESFFQDLATTRKVEFARYAAVIHLRTPTSEDGYNHQNPLRIESQRQARAIDARILDAWDGHPRRVLIPSTHDFVDKAVRAIAAIEAEIPECCLPRRT
jgi:predicted ATPase